LNTNAKKAGISPVVDQENFGDLDTRLCRPLKIVIAASTEPNNMDKARDQSGAK
jgi:hypothetical protein